MSKNDKKQSNPLFIIVVFLVIILLFIALPYIKGKREDLTIIPNKSNKDRTMEKTDDEQDAMSEYIKIDDNTTISFNNLKISNPVYSNNSLTLTIYSEKEINLDELEYYIEFYKDKSKFLFRRSLNGLIPSKTSTKIIINNITLEKDTYLAISHISKNTIPKKNFSTDESGISGFKCKYGDISYEYDFQNSKLIRVSKKYNYKSSNLEEFSSRLFDVQKEVNRLNSQEGVTASIVEYNKEFIYIVEVNYLEAANQKIDKYFFDKDELDRVIYFKMTAEGFDCV